MLRWLFLLLLLVNAVVLLWAALLRPDAVVVPQGPADEAPSLRLLSEVDVSQLKRLERAAAGGEPALCVSYQGLETGLEAEQVVQLMRRYGLAPVIEQERISRPGRYELVLNVPEDPQERIALIERVQSLDVVPESSAEAAQLVLGRYGSEAEAEAAAARFRNTGLAPELRLLDRFDEVLTVVIPVGSDRELFNKINRVLEQSYSGIKIEKKVCKGVASP
jgi:hypothetical protein